MAALTALAACGLKTRILPVTRLQKTVFAALEKHADPKTFEAMIMQSYFWPDVLNTMFD